MSDEMKCPMCGSRFSRIYKCGMCGEIRCGQETCRGSMDGPLAFATAGGLCRNCGEGRYNPVSYFSSELEDLKRKKKKPSAEDPGLW